MRKWIIIILILITSCRKDSDLISEKQVRDKQEKTYE